MPEDTPSFSEIIEKDRSRQGAQEWRGTFIEYLDKVKQDPEIPQLAHTRIHRVILAPGHTDIAELDIPPLNGCSVTSL